MTGMHSVEINARTLMGESPTEATRRVSLSKSTSSLLSSVTMETKPVSIDDGTTPKAENGRHVVA